MRVLENQNESWASKTNFVDENNVVVGFDMSASCCESFGWYFAESPDATEDQAVKPDADTLLAYRFDTGYHRTKNTGSDDGGEAVFMLTAPEKPTLFLVLYNHHNGYYSHGFDMTADGRVVISGSL